MTNPPVRFPDFYIIGAAKCGTTTLSSYLNKHPRIWMSDPKEPEYFSKMSPMPMETQQYLELFANAPADSLRGEASTIYTRFPYWGNVAERIFQKSPQAKLIYLVREPVYRAYADCAMIQRFWFNTNQRKKFDITFEDALQSENRLMASIRDTGRYYHQLIKYLKYFPPERIAIVTMGQLVDHPRETLRKILKLLNLDSGLEEILQTSVVLNRRIDFERMARQNQVAQRLSRIPILRLGRYLLPRSAREIIYQSLGKSGTFVDSGDFTLPPMTSKTFNELKEFYQDDILQLEQLSGIDLSSWKSHTYDDYLRQCESN